METIETIEDFEKWIAEYRPPPTVYVAVFDPITGKVVSIGPDFAFSNEVNKVMVDSHLAESIINAEIQIENCMIDISSGNLEIAELKTLVKLDDVLHRIISTEYSVVTTPDVYLTYTKRTKTLKIQLSQELGGTNKSNTEGTRRNFVWDGSTEMNFLITAYNDPNILYQTHAITINDLVGKTVTVKNIDFDHFSVYTRRLFKNYVIEYK
jgi:hypothetical protein